MKDTQKETQLSKEELKDVFFGIIDSLDDMSKEEIRKYIDFDVVYKNYLLNNGSMYNRDKNNDK